MPQTPPEVPNVDVMDAALLQRLCRGERRSCQKRVAAIDDDVRRSSISLVSALMVTSVIFAGGQHHPGGARLLELGDEFLQPRPEPRAPVRPRSRRTALGSLS